VNQGYYLRLVLRQGISTPSEYLVAALKDGGHQWALPKERTGRVNLSGQNPMRLDRRKLRQLQSTAKLAIKPDFATKATDLSLSSILSNYIRLLHPVLDQEYMTSSADALETADYIDLRLLLVYDEPTLEYLSQRGFSPEDVMTWAWIIVSQTSSKLSRRLTIASRESNKPAIPNFVFLLILRRPYLSAEALKLLLINAWDRLQISGSNSHDALEAEFRSNHLSRLAQASKAGQEDIDIPTFMIMIVRLTRHARRVWSAGLPSIASMIASYFEDVTAKNLLLGRSITAKSHARMTFLFNRNLSLLACPSSVNPFASVPYHQRAQFHLLQTMARLQPPVLVTKEGYRAIARVQVAHRKTIHEREWAKYKAKSWPPWKEEKLGIDAERGDEGKISRAGEVLGRMQEAGYDHDKYEQAATIFAGWDTDKSPTIQTQKLLRRANVIGYEDVKDSTTNQDVWAARIRATRTLTEAWACFLAYRDAKLPPSAEVYYAMAEKTFFSKRQSTKTTALAGDSKEGFPEPISPRELTYVRSPPPKMKTLLDQMQSDGLRPSGRFLAFLLSHAESLETGLTYLRRSHLRSDHVRALTTPGTLAKHSDLIKALPDYLFRAVIRLLCRDAEQVVKVDFESKTVPAPAPGPKTGFAVESSPTQDAKVGFLPIRHIAISDRIQNPLSHALEMMRIRESRYRPPWYDILAALARVGARLAGPYKKMPELSGWIAITQVLTQMERLDIDIDFEAFQILCVGLEKALLSQSELRNVSYKSDAIDDILYGGVVLIKREFERLVATAHKAFNSSGIKVASDPDSRVDPTTLIPHILSTPGSAHLHALIRILGLAGDFDGLLSLLQWMERFQPELQAAADERANGSRLMRRSLVAARVFLENSWISGNDVSSGASQEVIAKAYNTVERMQQWGGWASDEEVKIYVESGVGKRRFPTFQ
jgi:hypothetical protein